MNDKSEAEGNLMWRKVFGSKSKPRNWIGPILMLLLFGFPTIGGVWFIFVEGYEMRLQDWTLLGLHVLGTAASAGALWQEWRKRRTSD